MQRKFTNVGFINAYGTAIPQEVERQVCSRCNREQSTVCPSCNTRTRPCLLCHAQRCLCLVAGHRTHWYGGFPIVVMPEREPVRAR